MEDQFEVRQGIPSNLLSPEDLDQPASMLNLLRYKAIIRVLKEIISSPSEVTNDQIKFINEIYARLAGFPTTPVFGSEFANQGESLLSQTDMKTGDMRTLLKKSCQEVLKLLGNIPDSKKIDPVPRVFFIKMQGDFCHLLSKCQKNCEQNNSLSIENSEKAYLLASSLAAALLRPINPIRLNVSLCFAVFLYESKGNTSNAYKIAKKAYNLALEEADLLESQNFNESMAILQTLSDYLKSWSIDLENP